MENSLLSVKDAARKLDISPRHLTRMADSGRAPRPLRLGRAVKWRTSELDEWVSAGCPAVRTTSAAAPTAQPAGAPGETFQQKMHRLGPERQAERVGGVR